MRDLSLQTADDIGEQLYLFEATIQNLCIDGIPGPFKVKVKFINFPLLVFEQYDMSTYRADGLDGKYERTHIINEALGIEDTGATVFASGKSVLFSMKPKELIKNLQKYPVFINVYMRDARYEPSELMGQAKVRLEESFLGAVTLGITQSTSPVTAFIDDYFILTDVFGEERGGVRVNFKLSCFGTASCPCEAEIREEVGNDKGKSWKYCPYITADEHLPTEECETWDRTYANPVSWRKNNEAPLERAPSPKAVLPARTKGPEYQVEPIRVPSTKTMENPRYLPENILSDTVCTCPQLPELLNPTPEVQPSDPCPEELMQLLRTIQNEEMKGSPEPVAPIPINLLPEPPHRTNSLDLKASPEILDLHFPRTQTGDKDKPKGEPTGVRSANGVSESPAKAERLDSGKISADQSRKPVTDENTISLMNPKKKKFRSKKSIYDYTAGMYPGVHIGHKYCVPEVRFVPKNMGWLWNMPDLTGLTFPGRGWRPGAIYKGVAQLFKEWKKAHGLVVEEELMPVQVKKKTGVRKVKQEQRPGVEGGVLSPFDEDEEEEGEEQEIRPTLHVHKKDGYYYISMFPPKSESGPEPQPVKFKIDPKSGPHGEVYSSDESTTDDSLAFEYIAPISLQRSKPKAKRNTDTQYNPADFSKPVEKPDKVDEKPKESKGRKPKGGKGGKNAGGKKGAKKGKK